MPVPHLDAHGLLPAGVHDATVDEIEVTFGSGNTRRQELFAALRRFLTFSQAYGLFTAAYVDGSFTTDKPAPGDIDLVLELPRQKLPLLVGHPDGIKILTAAQIKAEYEVHLFIQPPPPPMAAFFQTLKPEEALTRSVPASHRRGILKVAL